MMRKDVLYRSLGIAMILCFQLILWSPAFGQNLGSRYVDSLNTLIKSKDLPEQELILNELLLAKTLLRQGNPDANEYVDRALLHAEKYSDPSLKLWAYALKSFSFVRKRQQEEAFKYLRKSTDLVSKADSRSKLQLELTHARFEWSFGSADEALYKYKKIVETARNLKLDEEYVEAAMMVIKIQNESDGIPKHKAYNDLIRFCSKPNLRHWRPSIAYNNLITFESSRDYEEVKKQISKTLQICQSEGAYGNESECLREAAFLYEIHSDEQAALQAHEQAFQVAHKHGLIPWEAAASFQLGQFLINTGEFDRADGYLQIARDNKKYMGYRNAALIFNQLSRISIFRKRFDEALSLLDSAYELYSLARYPNGMANIWSAKGNVYSELGQKAKWLNASRYSISIARDAGLDRVDTDRIFSAAAFAYTAAGLLDSAEQLALISLEHGRKLEDIESISISYVALNGVYEAKGNMVKAKECLDQYLALTRFYKNKLKIMYAYSILGDYHKKVGQNQLALTYYDSSLQLTMETGSINRLSDMYLAKAEIYHKIGMYQRAIEMVYRSMDADELNVESYSMLASIYETMGEYDKAIEMYRKTAQMYRNAGDRITEVGAMYSMGQCMAEKGNLTDAGMLFDSSLSAYRVAKDSVKIMRVLLSQAELSFNWNDTAHAATLLEEVTRGGYPLNFQGAKGQLYKLSCELEFRRGNLNRAIRDLDLAIKDNEKFGNAEALMQNLKRKSELYEKVGSYDSAYKAYTRFAVMRDSIHNVELRNELVRNELEYEFSKKEAAYLLSEEKAANLIRQKEKELVLNRQRILLANNEIALRNKDLDLQRLAHLRTQAELNNQKLELESQAAENTIKDSKIALLKKQEELQNLELNKKRRERYFLMSGAMALAILSLLIYTNWIKQKDLNRQVVGTNIALSQAMDDLKRTQDDLIKAENQKNLALEKARISRDLHDDLGGGLTKIAIMSELLQYKKEVNPEQVNEIAKTANELVDNMSQIIWVMNPENDKLENLFGYLRKYALDYFEDSPIRCILSFPDHIEIIHLSQVIRRNLFLVIKEIMHNTLKHSAATVVTLAANMEGSVLHVTITDDGKGFDYERARTTGNGLNNLQKRMKEINGQISAKTAPGEGCIWELTAETKEIMA